MTLNFPTMSLSLPSQLAIGGVVIWVSLSLYRRFFAPSPLDNLPGPPSDSVLVGNLMSLFNRYSWDYHRQLIHQYGPASVIRGLLGERMIYVFDPKALHHIVVKDQYVYEETSIALDFNRLFFGKGLLSSLGEDHRQQRKILNPVFNINHMRYMTPLFYRTAHRLREAITRQVVSGDTEIDMLAWMTRTALELVGQGGLGWSFDSLEKPETNTLAEHLKSLIPTISPLFLLMHFMPFFSRTGPAWLRRKVVENIPLQRVQKALEICDALEKTVKEIVLTKKTALAAGDDAVTAQIGEGKDILSVLMKAQMSGAGDYHMSEEELMGQMSILIFAAFETTSGALSHILHKLAEHQDVQDKLRQEITKAHEGRDELPYDELVALPYLEAVCRETLRLYAPLATLNRTTTEDIVMPLSAPVRGKDGKMISDVHLPKDTQVVMALWGSNINPAIWGEDAEVWKPERFLSPLPEAVTDAHIPGVYSNLMTFIGGGRACIGFKFSQLEMKVALSVLIEHFKFEVPPDKEIYWNFSGVQFPSVGRTDEHGQLPMRVSLIKKP